MAITKCITTPEELSKLATDFNISWSEAAQLGAKVLLGDMGIIDYPTNIRLYQKMLKFRKLAEEQAKEIDELKTQRTL